MHTTDIKWPLRKATVYKNSSKKLLVARHTEPLESTFFIYLCRDVKLLRNVMVLHTERHDLPAGGPLSPANGAFPEPSGRCGSGARHI